MLFPIPGPPSSGAWLPIPTAPGLSSDSPCRNPWKLNILKQYQVHRWVCLKVATPNFNGRNSFSPKRCPLIISWYKLIWVNHWLAWGLISILSSSCYPMNGTQLSSKRSQPQWFASGTSHCTSHCAGSGAGALHLHVTRRSRAAGRAQLDMTDSCFWLKWNRFPESQKFSEIFSRYRCTVWWCMKKYEDTNRFT